VKRLLTEEQMIAVVAATEQDIDVLQKQMAGVRPEGIAEWVIDGWRGGEQRLSVVQMDGRRVCVFWYWRAQSGSLVIGAAGSLSPGEDVWPALMAGLEVKARQLGCPEINFQTRRKGLIQKARNSGYAAIGVVLSKKAKYVPSNNRK
jgi:hypothetical protein